MGGRRNWLPAEDQDAQLCTAVAFLPDSDMLSSWEQMLASLEADVPGEPRAIHTSPCQWDTAVQGR